KALGMAVMGMAFGTVAVIASTMITKGAYVVYAIAFASSAVLILIARRSASTPWTLGAAAAHGALLIAAVGVSRGWAGDGAGLDTFIALCVVWLVVLIANRGTAPSR